MLSPTPLNLVYVFCPTPTLVFSTSTLIRGIIQVKMAMGLSSMLLCTGIFYMPRHLSVRAAAGALHTPHAVHLSLHVPEIATHPPHAFRMATASAPAYVAGCAICTRARRGRIRNGSQSVAYTFCDSSRAG
ncbi:hypothetical protein K438DRAFT_331114 [Mycena galopus ATCC 62051]|nr:hypothetical protein K438DRAFT_331114 [Mycena galopus ATCC 62051]